MKVVLSLEYNAVYSGRSAQTFRRNLSPLFSGLKSKTSKKPGHLLANFLLTLLVDPEDGVNTLL